MAGMYSEEIREELLNRLAEGEFLTSIARDKRMPTVRTILLWANAGDEYAARMREAREAGFEVEAERMVEEIKKCRDPQRARVLSEARRWRIGKLAQGALRDRPLVGVQVNVGDGDAFAAFAGALEEARAARASGAGSRRIVAPDSTPGATEASGD